MAPFAKRNASKFRVGFFEVSNRRHEPRIQTAHRNGVFQAGTHRVAGKSFGITYNDMAYVCAKGRFQRIGFRAGRAAAGRGIRFVRDEDELLGNIAAVQVVIFFRLGN